MSRGAPGIKALARRIIPAPILRGARRRWEDLRDWIDAAIFRLGFAAARRMRPKLLLYFGFALGDDLLCTAVLRELRRRGRDGLMMVSDHHQLFAGNPDPAYVRPLWQRYSRDASTVSICRRCARLWGGEFVRLEYAPLAGDDRSTPPARHIIAEMCARAGISGNIAIRPYLELTDAERAAGAWAAGRIIIQSSGMAARHPIPNKEWFIERFQAVVDALRDEVEFIQVGARADPPLANALDLRGGSDLRQTAAILSQARLYVGTVGFLMHLARAADCPAVIIYGGREAPWQSGYACNLNLFSEVACAPCWRWRTCDFDRRCMREIAAADVVSAIRRMLLRPRRPLAVETVEIVPGEIVPGEIVAGEIVPGEIVAAS